MYLFEISRYMDNWYTIICKHITYIIISLDTNKHSKYYFESLHIFTHSIKCSFQMILQLLMTMVLCKLGLVCLLKLITKQVGVCGITKLITFNWKFYKHKCYLAHKKQFP